jgi:hypothetical protein
LQQVIECCELYTQGLFQFWVTSVLAGIKNSHIKTLGTTGNRLANAP